MSDPVDLFPSLSALLRDVLGHRLVPAATTLLDMVADEIVFEFPYAPSSGIKRLDGKEALAAYLPGIASLITMESLVVTAVHHSVDSEVVIIEFTATGHGRATGHPFEQHYISVIRVRNGMIVHFRDYWNPLVAIAVTEAATAVASTPRENLNVV